MRSTRKYWLIPAALLAGSFITLVLILTRTADYTYTGDLANDVQFALLGIVFSAVGGLIIYRKPEQVIGWLCMGVPLLTVIALPVQLYFDRLFPSIDQVTTGFWIVSYLISISWWGLIGPLFLIMQLFPTGKPINTRWRWVARFLGFTFLFFALLAAIAPEIYVSNLNLSIANPLSFLPESVFNPLLGLFSAMLLISAFLSVAAVLVRYRRADLQQRQQIKWLLYAAVLFFLSYLPGFFAEMQAFDIWGLLFSFSIFTIPVAIGIAILRYNLWNIDLVINRTLVAAALTAMLVLLFLGASWAVNTLLAGTENGAMYSAVSAALLFGVVFQPARKNIQRFVDRRFYRIMIDYQKTPADLEPDFDTSQTTFGQYKDLVLVGRGGMGEVFRASAPDVRDHVAIKIMPPNLVRDATQRRRFEREAQLAANLKHANIVKVIEYGAVGDVPYLVMEYINGPDLADHLRKVKRIPLMDAIPTIRQVADALDYAHKHGYVHRDIKPSNIMLEEKNGGSRAVLMDFGIAKILGEATLATRSGFLGTLDYIAPEQIQSAADIDPRADVYSFGVLVYQMLSGRLPFKSNNPGGMLLAHLTQPAPDIREIAPDMPERVAASIQQAMAKLPAERFSSAGEFAAALMV